MRYGFHAIIAVLLVLSASALELPKETNIGVYITDGSEWLQAPVETVTWRSGGAVKHALSEGAIREDLNGIVPGETSPVELSRTARIQVLIHATPGTAGEKYRLLRLHLHTDAREFQSLSGGFRASSEAQRDLIPYKVALVAPSTWRVDLNGLPEGKYGFLSPVNSAYPATSGKIYTFDIGKCELCNSPWAYGYTKSRVKNLVLNPPSAAFDFR